MAFQGHRIVNMMDVFIHSVACAWSQFEHTLWYRSTHMWCLQIGELHMNWVTLVGESGMYWNLGVDNGSSSSSYFLPFSDPAVGAS